MAPVERRTVLLGLAASALLAALPARAAGLGLRSIEAGPRGTTIELGLEHAPFPAAGAPYQDPTVLVFVPRHFRLAGHRRVDLVVHFHGHHHTARAAMVGHQLREQLAESKQNAILVVPQGPVSAADSSGGKLEQRGGLARMLSELLRQLRTVRVSRALGKASLAGARGAGLVCLSAHSGGYRVLAACLSRGGIGVSEAYLFDALYGCVDDFRRWVVAGKGRRGRSRHKLISYHAGGEVRRNNLALMAQLERAGVPVLQERRPGELTRAQLTRGRAIFITTPVSHGKVAFRDNTLRDCLYASGLERHLDSDWFDHKNQSREIDRRGG